MRLRDNWLNPPDLDPNELNNRTLTNLYNLRPAWLGNAHDALDRAVFAAYGFPSMISRDEILARLLQLNLERTGIAQPPIEAFPPKKVPARALPPAKPNQKVASR